MRPDSDELEFYRKSHQDIKEISPKPLTHLTKNDKI